MHYLTLYDGEANSDLSTGSNTLGLFRLAVSVLSLNVIPFPPMGFSVKAAL
jgi:hypothetical protein